MIALAIAYLIGANISLALLALLHRDPPEERIFGIALAAAAFPLTLPLAAGNRLAANLRQDHERAA